MISVVHCMYALVSSSMKRRETVMAAATAQTRPPNSVPMAGLDGFQMGGGRPIVLRQLLLWWLNSPWAPGHICGVSVMLVVVVVLLFSVLVQGLTR